MLRPNMCLNEAKKRLAGLLLSGCWHGARIE